MVRIFLHSLELCKVPLGQLFFLKKKCFIWIFIKTNRLAVLSEPISTSRRCADKMKEKEPCMLSWALWKSGIKMEKKERRGSMHSQRQILHTLWWEQQMDQSYPIPPGQLELKYDLEGAKIRIILLTPLARDHLHCSWVRELWISCIVQTLD